MKNSIVKKFNKKCLTASILSAALLSQTQAAPMAPGSILSIDQGSGSTGNQPCATGSCFGMNVAPGFIAWTDFGPGIDSGIVVGKNQASGGQENQLAPVDNPAFATPIDNPAFATPGEVTNAWGFFSNYGTFSTPQGATNIFSHLPCAGAACIGVTELRSWDWNWNGSSVPLGSANDCLSTRCTPDQLAGIFVSDWAVNNADGTYRLDYGFVVPNGDSTGFGNVPFTLILRGVIMLDGSALPEANFDTPTGIVVNQPAQFTDTSRFIGNGTALLVSWNWDFGDGSTSTQQNPVYTYTQVGSYTVSLTVGDDQANVNTSSQGIVVNPIPSPSPTPTFTPTPTPTFTPTFTPTPTIQPSPTPPPPPVQVIPIVTGSVLGIDQGVGAGANTPCVTGSCFAMEVAPGFVVWTDFGHGADSGIVVGKNQVSGGQENQPTPKENLAFTTPGEVTNAWEFFNNYGTFFTPQGATNIFNQLPCAGAACIGVTELISWNWAWNGKSTPMGSANGCLSARCTLTS